jgi:hypothetical protein
VEVIVTLALIIQYHSKINELYELYELYYRITQITGKPVFYIVVQKYI